MNEATDVKTATSELTGAALEWAVAKCDGYDDGWLQRQLTNPHAVTRCIPLYARNWSEGGPIIEREKISVDAGEFGGNGQAWMAVSFDNRAVEYGPTALIAAMRCFVAGKLGGQVDVPRELAP
jgi:hypothetical protein